MSRNRSTNPVSKQTTISSISSYIPLMTPTSNDDMHFATQSLKNTNATADVHNFSESLPMASNRDSKRSLTLCQPKGTTSYIVGDNDTLEKVALRFNSTTSELRQLNKLSVHIIFPGQILFVPEERSSNISNQPQSTSTSLSPPPVVSPLAVKESKNGDAFILLSDRRLSREFSFPPDPSINHQQQQQAVGREVWSMARQTAAKPGFAQRLNSETSIENEPSSKTIEDHSEIENVDINKPVKILPKSPSIDESHHLDEECVQRFIKVNVRLMTEDHKNVAGTLLVTPNAVMFDPDVLDQLVKEHGIDKYGLIIRMDLLAGIALYEDLAMYEHEATARDEEKRKMCHSTSVKHAQHSPVITLNTDEEQIHDVMSSLLDKIDKELNPSISTDTCCMLFNASSQTQRQKSRNSLDDHLDHDTSLPTATDEILLNDSLEFSSDSFQPFDDYKHSIGILLDNDDNNNNNINKNFNRVPSQGCHLENCVSLDQFNKRFGEIDKLLHKQQQNYLAPQPIEVPYYLSIKTSMHVHDIPSLYARQYKKHNGKSIDNVYGKKQLENEYWFSVPKEKTDQLYSFFLRWSPERVSDPLIDNVNQPSNIDHSLCEPAKLNDKSPPNKGFVLLASSDPELTDDCLSTTSSTNDYEPHKKSHYLKRQNTLLKDWEIISVDEIYRRFNATHSNDMHPDDSGIPAPTLLQPSTLLKEEQTKQILLELPARVHGLRWYMTFSTESHGFSLNQLYRQSLAVDHDLPSLLIIKDVEQHIFGAYASHQLMISEGFYGRGESFLFTFHPEFRVFNWSGCNEFFVKGDLHAIGFGSGEGTYGLWLDASLYHGRTCPSKTFNNERLSSNEDFIVASVEVWTFID